MDDMYWLTHSNAHFLKREMEVNTKAWIQNCVFNMAQYEAGAATQRDVFPSAFLTFINGHPKIFLLVNATKGENVIGSKI